MKLRPFSIFLCLAAGVSGQQVKQSGAGRPPTPATAKPGSTVAPRATSPAAPAGANTVPQRGPDLTLGLKFPAAAAFSPAALSWSTLPNGLEFAVIENRELPLVQVSFVFDAGSAFDPPSKAGLAELTQEVLLAGGPASGSHGKRFSAHLESLGALASARTNPAWSEFSFQFPSPSLARFLPLIRDLLASPGFDPDSTDEAMGRHRDQLAARNASLPVLVNREFLRAASGAASPLGRRVEYDDLDNIGREDLAAFHRRHYNPRRAKLIVEGDLDSAQAATLLRDTLSAWTAAAQDGPPEASQPFRPVPGWHHAEVPQQQAVLFALGAPGCGYQDADLPALLVLLRLVELELSGLAQANPRWGLAVSAGLTPGFTFPSIFHLSGQVAPLHATEAIRAAAGRFERVTAANARLLDEARSRALSQWVAPWTRRSSRTNLLLLSRLAGIPESHPASVHRAIAAVDSKDVEAAAAKYLKAEQLVRVVVGRELSFDRPLSEIARAVNPIDLTIPPPKPPVAKTDAASLAQGKAWIARWQQALGGAGKLAAIRDYSANWEASHTQGPSATAVTYRDRWVSELSYRQDQRVDKNETTIFFNGKIGWVWASGKGLGRLPDIVHHQVVGEIFRLPFLLPLSDRDPSRSVSHLGANVIQITDNRGNSARVYLDEESGLPVRMIYSAFVAPGASASREESYSDWREVGGIRLPGKIVTKQNGRRYSEATLVEARFNSGLSLSEIEKKP